MWRPLTSAYCPTPFASVVQSIAVMLSLLAPRRLLVMVLIRPPSAVVSVVLSAITFDNSSRIREARGSSGLDDRDRPDLSVSHRPSTRRHHWPPDRRSALTLDWSPCLPTGPRTCPPRSRPPSTPGTWIR